MARFRQRQKFAQLPGITPDADALDAGHQGGGLAPRKAAGITQVALDFCKRLEVLDVLHRGDASRVIPVAWGARPAKSYEVDVVVRGFDRKWLHKDVSNVIAAANAHVVALNARVDARRGVAEMNYTLKVADFGQLSALLSQLLAVPNVTEARRLA